MDDAGGRLHDLIKRRDRGNGTLREIVRGYYVRQATITRLAT
jgi:hypothetical protein